MNLEPNFPSIGLENSKRLMKGILKKYDSFGIPHNVCSPALVEASIPIKKEMFFNFIELAKQYRNYVYDLKDGYGFDYFAYPSATAANILLHQMECCMFDTENRYISFYIHELNFGEVQDKWGIFDEDGEKLTVKTPQDLWDLLIKNICETIKEI